MSLTNSIDAALRRRALRVVPGGLWGHMNAARLPSGYPQFFARADGTRIEDVDGNSYVDFMCSWGPIILGHHAPEVEEAVRRQQDRGDCMNGPGEALVELAELVVDTIPAADWVQFSKNGTDATTTAVTIARAGTGRRKLLVARGAITARCRGARPRSPASRPRTARICCTMTITRSAVCRRRWTRPAATLPGFW